MLASEIVALGDLVYHVNSRIGLQSPGIVVWIGTEWPIIGAPGARWVYVWVDGILHGDWSDFWEPVFY